MQSIEIHAALFPAKKSVGMAFILIEIAKSALFIWRKPPFWQFFDIIFAWHSF
jgi:hypothetical protein